MIYVQKITRFYLFYKGGKQAYNSPDDTGGLLDAFNTRSFASVLLTLPPTLLGSLANVVPQVLPQSVPYLNR